MNFHNQRNLSPGRNKIYQYLIVSIIGLFCLYLYQGNSLTSFFRFGWTEYKIAKDEYSFFSNSFVNGYFRDCKYCSYDFFENRSIDTIEVIMKPSSYANMMKEHKKRFKNDVMGKGTQWLKEHQRHKGRIKFNNKKQKVDIKFIGMNNDHFYNPSMFNFRLKLKRESRLFSRKKINLLKPSTRFYMLDYLSNKVYKNLSGGIAVDYKSVYVIFQKKHFGVYLMEDFFSKELIESNGYRESIIFEDKWEKPVDNIYGTTENVNHSIDSIRTTEITNELFQQLHLEGIVEYIDFEKMMYLLSLSIINDSDHQLIPMNLHWFYNSVTNKIEPTFREVTPGFTESLNFEIKNIDDRHKLYNYFFDLQFVYGKTDKPITKHTKRIVNSFIKVNFQDSKAFCETLDKYLFLTIEESNLFLKGVEYSDFVKNLGLRHANFVSFEENKLVERVKKLENSFLTGFSPSAKAITIDSIFIEKNKIVAEDWTIEKNKAVFIKEGIEIKFEADADLYVYGQIKSLGSKENRVKFISEEDSNSSIYIETDQPVGFYFSDFGSLSSLSKGIWKTPSAITAYETKIEFDNCLFLNNTFGDDYLNLFRCNDFSITQSKFEGVLSDAIDSDFSTGTINECDFINIGNDAIDGSGSKITIDGCNFTNVEDKGISAGEASHFIVRNVVLDSCAIAFVSKDKSILEVENIKMTDNQLDFCVFQKKPEYGPGTLFLKSGLLTDYKYLIEMRSRIQPNNEIKYVKKVEEKLYGNEYGKASKK